MPARRRGPSGTPRRTSSRPAGRPRLRRPSRARPRPAVDVELESGSRPERLDAARVGHESVADPERRAGGDHSRRRRAGEDAHARAGVREFSLRGQCDDEGGHAALLSGEGRGLDGASVGEDVQERLKPRARHSQGREPCEDRRSSRARRGGGHGRAGQRGAGAQAPRPSRGAEGRRRGRARRGEAARAARRARARARPRRLRRSPGRRPVAGRAAGHGRARRAGVRLAAAEGRSGRRRSPRRPPGYVLEIAHESVDVQRFLRLSDEGRAALQAGDPAAAEAALRAALGALARHGARRLPRTSRSRRTRSRGWKISGPSCSRSASRPISRSAATRSSSPSSRHSSPRSRCASARARS